MDPINYPIEPLPQGWATALVSFKHHDGRREHRIEIINLKTNIRYMHEPVANTALKCFMLLIGIPIYFMGYIGWQILRAPFVVGGTVLAAAGRLLCHPNGRNVKQLFHDVFLAVPGSVVKGIWSVVRAPFYAVAMEFAALYGVFKPLQGRILVGQIEKSWHHPKTRRDDLFRMANPDDPMLLLRALADKDFPYTFFLAYCMQPYGKLTDGHIERDRMQILQPKSEPPPQGIFPLPA